MEDQRETVEVYIEKPEIDFLILADRAEILNGKLYMMGGGWDRRTGNSVEGPVEITVAIGILIPWNLTNENHDLVITLEHEDGRAIEPEVRGSVNVGRPIQATRGQTFRIMAVVRGTWNLPGEGAYRIVAALPNSRAEKAITFYQTKVESQSKIA